MNGKKMDTNTRGYAGALPQNHLPISTSLLQDFVVIHPMIKKKVLTETTNAFASSSRCHANSVDQKSLPLVLPLFNELEEKATTSGALLWLLL